MFNIKQSQLLRMLQASAMVMLVFSIGCGPKSTPKSELNMTSLEASFSSADPATKAVIEKVTGFMKAENYGAAADLLRRLLNEKQLTREQEQAAKTALAEASKHPRLAP